MQAFRWQNLLETNFRGYRNFTNYTNKKALCKKNCNAVIIDFKKENI